MKIYFHLNIAGFSNCYVVVNEQNKQALIIDPGKLTSSIIANIEDGGYNLTGVLVTHNHGSHVHGLKTLQKIYTPEIYAADWETARQNTKVLKDDGIITVAGLHVVYMSLPGHTADSMVYKIGQALFTGDSISAGRLGSTSNKFSAQILRTNIMSKIMTMEDDTVIMPGHGPITSVLAERRFNSDLYPKAAPELL